MPDADKLVFGACIWAKENGYEVHILTAIPLLATMPTAAKDKQVWILENVEDGHSFKFKIGPHAKDKQNHAKPGDILIDDQKRNIEQWITAGGIGIHHTSAESSLSELFGLWKPLQ
jgi:5'(3')-deoxyribonucleotidase